MYLGTVAFLFNCGTSDSYKMSQGRKYIIKSKLVIERKASKLDLTLA